MLYINFVFSDDMNLSVVALLVVLHYDIRRYLQYRIVQKFDGGKLTNLMNAWLAIRQSFPYKPLSLKLYISPLKLMINSSKFYLLNFCTIQYYCTSNIIHIILELHT